MIKRLGLIGRRGVNKIETSSSINVALEHDHPKNNETIKKKSMAN
jgi:hypothetical protein